MTASPRIAVGALAFVAAVSMLLAPALWNGFPLLQYDTGGYLARWYEGHLEESRSTVFGLFLTVLARPDFWPAVVVQALATVWTLRLTLRAHGFGWLALVVVTAVLCVTTALPWLTSMLLTDIFTGLSVLALYLLMLRSGYLGRVERIALVTFVAFAAATHSATLAVLIGLVICGALAALVARRRMRIRPASGIAALALSAVLLLAANAVVSSRIAWTPGGLSLLFGRTLESGIAPRYLAEHCPDARIARLCEHRNEIPNDADLFFWGSDLFDKLGRFEGLGDEMSLVVRESLTAYPLMHLKAAVTATATQLAMVATGYGVHTELWHSIWTIERFAPAAVPAMQAARQQRGELGFDVINRLHVPVAWLSMALLGVVVLLWAAQRGFVGIGPLAAVALLAILGNAFVCGALSNPHDRYGARIVWLAPFVLMLAAARQRR